MSLPFVNRFLYTFIVGGFNTFDKYQSNVIISQREGKNKNSLKAPPSLVVQGGPYVSCPGSTKKGWRIWTFKAVEFRQIIHLQLSLSGPCWKQNQKFIII